MLLGSGDGEECDWGPELAPEEERWTAENSCTATPDQMWLLETLRGRAISLQTRIKTRAGLNHTSQCGITWIGLFNELVEMLNEVDSTGLSTSPLANDPGAGLIAARKLAIEAQAEVEVVKGDEQVFVSEEALRNAKQILGNAAIKFREEANPPEGNNTKPKTALDHFLETFGENFGRRAQVAQKLDWIYLGMLQKRFGTDVQAQITLFVALLDNMLARVHFSNHFLEGS